MAKETISQTEGLCKEVANCIRNAYDRGYKQGFKDGNYDKEFFCNLNFEHGTNKGLDDAWELVRKLRHSSYEGTYSDDEKRDIFGYVSSDSILTNLLASEAVKRVKAWEEKQKAGTIQQERDCEHCSNVYGTLGCCTTVSNKWVYSCEEGHKQYAERHKADDEVKVGDEVIDGKVFNSGKGIVTFVSPIVIYVLWYDGSTGRRKLEDIKKTGRYFGKITEVLEQMKGE